MKIVAWNVQGAKKRQLREELKLLQRSKQPDIMFVIETMASERTSNQILPVLGFDNYDFVVPVQHLSLIHI